MAYVSPLAFAALMLTATGTSSVQIVSQPPSVAGDGRRVFHKRSMARALGLKSGGGNAFMKTMQGKGLGSGLPENLREKINNPLNFKPLTQDLAHGYDADVLDGRPSASVTAMASRGERHEAG